MGAQRLSKDAADRPGHCSGHDPGGHAEPGVVIDAGEDRALGAVGQQHPAHHVELPQFHGPGPLPALERPQPLAPGTGIDQAVAHQCPPDPHVRWHRIHTLATELVGDAVDRHRRCLSARFTFFCHAGRQDVLGQLRRGGVVMNGDLPAAISTRQAKLTAAESAVHALRRLRARQPRLPSASGRQLRVSPRTGAGARSNGASLREADVLIDHAGKAEGTEVGQL
jgi:hypothetical protein